MTAAGNTAQPFGINSEGLKRRGFTPEAHRRAQARLQDALPSGWRWTRRSASSRRRPQACAEVRRVPRLPRAPRSAASSASAGRRPRPRRHGGRRGLGRPAGAHLIGALQARRPAAAVFRHRRARDDRRRASSRMCPMEKLGGARLRRGAAALPRDRAASAASSRRACSRERPALFIGVDASDFNLGLERKLKDAGIPTIHYVSPSIWAWRGWRIQPRSRARSTTCWCCFRSSRALYEKAGIPVTYVGHPLADVIPLEPDKAEARARAAPAAGKRVVALLPGSRRSELHYMADAVRARPRAACCRTLPGCALRRADRVARDARACSRRRCTATRRPTCR